MSKYFIILPLFGLLLFTGCSQQQTKYSAVPHTKMPKYSKYNYSITVPTAEYEFSNEKLASMIKELEGCEYVWAEEGPHTFDCSGYLYYMFGKMGVNIPRVAREQIKQGTPIDMANLKFGDFIFFNTTKTKSDKITHVGIYLKDGWFSHASSSNHKITYANINTNKFYNERFMGARRYTQENNYVAFEPELSRYAINRTNQGANEVTTYANNNIKPIAQIAMVSKPQPLSTQKVAMTTPTITPIIASAITPAITIPRPVQEIAVTPTVAKVEAPILLASVTQADKTTIEVDNSVQIAYNELPAATNMDIKRTELNSDTVKTAATKLPEARIAQPTRLAANKITQPKVTPVTKTNPTGYYVQLGQFQNKPNGELLKKITKNGYAYTLMPSQSSNNKLSKLLIGPFKNKKDAGDTLNSVQEKIEEAAFITKVNS
jgi:cell division septation protein DedD